MELDVIISQLYRVGGSVSLLHNTRLQKSRHFFAALRFMAVAADSTVLPTISVSHYLGLTKSQRISSTKHHMHD
ncbi:unnamed protein product [Sphenostylis stenocarpa]|uniref:Uncharacterized protein n=1 Tax=Sphenostylis stenocarpa TaxID=92480 RepID=A0AA86V5G2_9FABA|nr:unnamed protein product [Sphenostylis stenocarpa]